MERLGLSYMLSADTGCDGPSPCPMPEGRPLFVPEADSSPDFFDNFILKPVRRVTLRPIGVPWFLPGELGTNKQGDLPGPGIGLGLSWTPTRQWRFGADLVMRADRVDADNRLHDWTVYLAPGVAYIPFPNSAHPFSVGVVAPVAPHHRGEDYAAVFLVMRWNESVSRQAKLPRRGLNP